MLTALTNASFFTGAKKLKGKALLFDETGIKDFIDPNDVPDEATIVDAGGVNVAPGLIDLQIYGAGGRLFSAQPNEETLRTVTDAIVRSGTTSFLLTLATNSVPVFRDAIHTAQYHPHPALLGLHLEGPYINSEKRGAHLLQFIKKPTAEEVKAMLAEAEGVVKMMTLAPEVCDAGIIKQLTNGGVVVSAGHSNATYEEALQGFATGIGAVTHLFNAMSSLHHRATGLPGATLASGTYASIIADGIHVDYSAITLSKKALGEKLFLITDAVSACNKGPYQHVETTDRYTLPDGTLSGSKLTLLQAVKNCVQHCGIPLDEALRMASLYPARLMGANDLGRLEAGAKANFVLFDDDYEVQSVYLNGSRL